MNTFNQTRPLWESLLFKLRSYCAHALKALSLAVSPNAAFALRAVIDTASVGRAPSRASSVLANATQY